MDKSKKTLTFLSEMGEFGLIEHLTANLPLYHKSTVKGVGDDAAVLEYNGKNLVVTSDMLMEGIHFDLMYTPLKHLGYKAAIVNFSDVYAMNAIPKQLLIAVALSKKFSLEALEQFYEGLRLACETYNVDLVGGDTSSSLTGMAICITVIGEAVKEEITYRSGAKENDLICVSGDLGAAYAGLQILEREKNIYQESKGGQPILETYDYVLQRQLKPEAKKDLVEFFHNRNIKPSSMIDISDGLSSEVIHLCKQSDTGCKLFSHKIPIADQTVATCGELNLEPIICALNGGEDYELLFTLPLQNYDIIALRNDVSIIGHITHKSEGCYMITEQNQQIPLLAQGWNAYQ
jgi:thiamine-monophosphate kinase